MGKQCSTHQLKFNT